MTRPLVEVCLDSAEGVAAAAQAGAERVELCANLIEGGTTPSAGALGRARETSGIGIMAMIRPRAGDFVYDAGDLDVMARDIDVVGEGGADGVVFGFLRADGEIDEEKTARFVERARPMEVTFHRAFDMSRDLSSSLEVLADLGVSRVLTSGGHATALEGMDILSDLVAQAGDRIVVMPGGGIEEGDVQRIATQTGCQEIHFTAFCHDESPMTYRNAKIYMGVERVPGEYERQSTDPGRIAAFLKALES